MIIDQCGLFNVNDSMFSEGIWKNPGELQLRKVVTICNHFGFFILCGLFSHPLSDICPLLIYSHIFISVLRRQTPPRFLLYQYLRYTGTISLYFFTRLSQFDGSSIFLVMGPWFPVPPCNIPMNMPEPPATIIFMALGSLIMGI